MHRPDRAALNALLVALTLGCAPVPRIGPSLTAAEAAAPYPDLVPLGPVLERAADSPSAEASAEAGEATRARAAALQDRAARLRGPVVETAERDRMDRGVSEAALP